jgi:iron-sulfur cluster repair protein YtfE (RIC family)
MNAIELLKKDHQEALGLIGKLESADERPGTDPTDTENFNRLNEALKLHSQIEEEFLYPVMEEIEETRGLVEEAYEEHEKVDELLARLSAKAPKQEEFQGLLAELRSSLENHIQKEEDELFPKVEENLDQGELDDLGARIQELKQSGHAAAAATKRR